MFCLLYVRRDELLKHILPGCGIVQTSEVSSHPTQIVVDVESVDEVRDQPVDGPWGSFILRCVCAFECAYSLLSLIHVVVVEEELIWLKLC